MVNPNYQFFMNSDVSEYSGKWIAICKQEIISSGEDVKKVYSEAKKKCPKSKPLITRVPTEETMIF